MRTLTGRLLPALLAVALLGIGSHAFGQDAPDDPAVLDVAQVTAAADAVAQAQRELGDIERTMQRRTAERADVADDDAADWCNARGRRCAERHAARLAWYDDALAALAERKAAASGRLAAAQAILDGAAVAPLAERVQALEAEVDELTDELHAVEDELGLEIARVEAAIPATTVPEVVHRTTSEIVAGWQSAACYGYVGYLHVPPEHVQGTPSWPNNAANAPDAWAADRPDSLGITLNLQWLADHEPAPKPCHGLLAEWIAAGHPGSEGAGQ